MPIPDDGYSVADPAPMATRTCQHAQKLSRADSGHRILTVCTDCGAFHEEWGRPDDAWVVPPALLTALAQIVQLRAAANPLPSEPRRPGHECPLPTEWPEQPKDATARLPYCKVCGTLFILVAGKGWHKIVPVKQHYSPPSAPQGEGGGVVNPESAEGASSNTPEEPCRRIVLNGHYDDGGPSRTIIYCGTHEQPIDTCRVRELEAIIEGFGDSVAPVVGHWRHRAEAAEAEIA